MWCHQQDRDDTKGTDNLWGFLLQTKYAGCAILGLRFTLVKSQRPAPFRQKNTGALSHPRTGEELPYSKRSRLEHSRTSISILNRDCTHSHHTIFVEIFQHLDCQFSRCENLFFKIVWQAAAYATITFDFKHFV